MAAQTPSQKRNASSNSVRVRRSSRQGRSWTTAARPPPRTRGARYLQHLRQQQQQQAQAGQAGAASSTTTAESEAPPAPAPSAPGMAGRRPPPSRARPDPPPLASGR